jgi:PAS domain S-box-containing protein
MENQPPDAGPHPTSPFGTTMRIDLSPEMLEEAKRPKGKTEGRRRTQPLIRIPQPRAMVARPGSVDFQQLLQNIYDAGLVTELDGEIVMVNLRANQFFLAEPGQLNHCSVLSLICGADQALLPTILDTLKANRFVLMQAYCQRLDGTFFSAEISVNQLRLADKDRLSFFIRDITLRKEQEDRLRTGYTALQNASSGITITDGAAIIEYSNPAFLEMFALADGEAMEGRNLREFLCEPDTADEIIARISAGETWSGELEMKRANETRFFAQASVTANVNADGEHIGMVLSLLDVTPQKHAQQQLEAYAAELRTRNAQMQEDLNIASELHRAFLPGDLQVFPREADSAQGRLHVRHLYSPSGTIGGDFFDVRQISDSEVALFISDVMGHGIRSALVVSTIRGLIEQLRSLAPAPDRFLTQLNATYSTIFRQIGGSVTFCTALYAVMNLRTGVLRCANAGHPHPYLLRPETGEVTHLPVSGDVRAALGLFGASEYAVTEFQLAPRDVLLLYTDGLSEAANQAGALFDERSFGETVRACLNEPVQMLPRVMEAARSFSGAETFDDDVCLVSMECLRLDK